MCQKSALGVVNATPTKRRSCFSRREVTTQSMELAVCSLMTLTSWRSVHDKQGAVGTDDVGRGLEVDSFALRQATPDRQRNLEGKASGASALWISGSLHMGSLCGDA